MLVVKGLSVVMIVLSVTSVIEADLVDPEDHPTTSVSDDPSVVPEIRRRSRRQTVEPKKLGPAFHIEPPSFFAFSNNSGECSVETRANLWPNTLLL